MSFLLHWPLWASALLVYALFLAVALGLVFVVGRWVRRQPARETVVGGLVPPVGAAMTAGFLVWMALLANTEVRDIDDAERAVNAEAAALHALGVLGSTAAPAAAAGWNAQLADYAQRVLAHEWPRMAQGGDDGTSQQLDRLRTESLTRFAAESPELRAALRQGVQALAEARQARLRVAADHIPGVIWYALLMSAVIVLAFSALIHARQPRAARWIGTLLALLIAVQVHAVYVIDRPFVGAIAVGEGPLRSTLQQLQTGPAR